MLRRFALALALIIGLTAASASAQEPAPTPAPTPTPAGATTQARPGNAPDPDKRLLFQLRGGGEVLGWLSKETPDALFIDIGPEIVRVPLEDVDKRLTLEEATAQASTAKATNRGTGVFDAETGSLIFRQREASQLRSRTDVLAQAKRSVVLVSNARGLGSGWVLDKTGRIVTNHHVIGNEKYQTVTIFVPSGGQWEKKRIENCRVEAFSALLDIAIVQLDMDAVRKEGIELVPMPIAPVGSLEAGDTVFAIGNPGMGRQVLEHSISEGIVSSLARNFNDVVYVQTTAAVNPGNSGGPLLNDRGEVVGLITLKASFQEGIAFALPNGLITHFLSNSRAFASGEGSPNRGFRYLPPE